MRDYLIGGLALIGLALMGTLDFDDEVYTQERYCTMVDLYKTSGGSDGWPAYRAGEISCTD